MGMVLLKTQSRNMIVHSPVYIAIYLQTVLLIAFCCLFICSKTYINEKRCFLLTGVCVFDTRRTLKTYSAKKLAEDIRQLLLLNMTPFLWPPSTTVLSGKNVAIVQVFGTRKRT